MNEDYFMGSFASFTNLKILHIPPYSIVEMDDDGMPAQSLVDRLPPSLELLSITYFGDNWLDWVLDECKLLLCSNVCPKLKTICTEDSEVYDDEIASKIMELYRRCKDAGLSLQSFESDDGDLIEYLESIWPFDHSFDR